MKIEVKPSQRFTPLLLLTLLICSCAGKAPAAVPIDSADVLVQALRAAGAEVQPDHEVGQPLMELFPESVRLGGERIWIYSSVETFDPGQVRQELTTDPGRQYVWVVDHLIVQYKGNDGGTVLLLDSVLGEALIMPAAAGDEPYPPAIPAALRIVAAEMGVSPADVDVLSYEAAEWPNACLGFEQPGELCAEVITSGWHIDLRQGVRQIEVHTDELGETVRWR